MAEKSSVNELGVSCGIWDGLSELVEELGELALELGVPLLPQAATISAALLRTAVAATALVTERKVNHLIFGRDALAPGGYCRPGVRELSPRGMNCSWQTLGRYG
jgi:hypothetical protein